MAHAIFNVSPVKFLNSIQDHVFTVTPTFKNKSKKRQGESSQHSNNNSHLDSSSDRHSSASPVTLQLTLPTDSMEQQQQQQQMAQQAPSVPIDIPRSYPLNVPFNNSNNNGTAASEGLMPNMAYNSYNSFGGGGYTDNNLVALTNSIPNNQSPYLPADDLTLCFDGLAVRSPTGSHYSNHNGFCSPQQINSPVNIGSPHSPIYFGSPQSPSNLNSNHFLAHSPSYVGSPHSTHFLGSPAITPFLNETATALDPNYVPQDISSSYGLAYLSPSLSATNTHLSPVNSPSPTGSYAGNNSNYLFPPTMSQYSRPSSPVPDDVILTASEVNDYMNSPYLSTSVGSNTASAVQPLSINTKVHNNGNNSNQISEFLFGQQPTSPLNASQLDEQDLFPAFVEHFSPQAQPHMQPHEYGEDIMVFSKEEIMEESSDNYPLSSSTPTPAPVPSRSSNLLLSPSSSSTVKKTTPMGRKAKIHKCPHCQHTSNRANNMREHVQIHNPNRPKPHNCRICHRAFARKHDMNRHYLSCKKQHTKGGGNMGKSLSPSLIS